MDTLGTMTIDEPITSDEMMLTTVDNPYDPFTEWDNWFAFDEQSGYHTCGLLARLALTSNSLSDEANEQAINHAINDILNLFPTLYKVVKRN